MTQIAFNDFCGHHLGPASVCGFAVSEYQSKETASQADEFEPNETWTDRPHIPDGQEMELLLLLSGDQAQQSLHKTADHSDPTDGLPFPPHQASNSCDEAQTFHCQPLVQEPSTDLQAQLAATEVQLIQLKLQNQNLLRRNGLLEKIAHMDSKWQNQTHTSVDQNWEDLFAPFREASASAQNGPAVIISVLGQPFSLTVQDVTALSKAQFATIYTEYARQMGGLLVKLKDCSDPLAASLEILASECVKFMGCVCVVNPTVLMAAYQGHIDEQLASKQKLDSALHTSCLQAMALSEGQNQDLLYLRHLYITKRSVLHAKRQAYLNETCMGGTEPLHPHADLNHFTNLASVLKETAMQDCKAYHQLCHAVFKGVCSRQQIAVMFVHMYPYLPSVETTINTLASLRGVPDKHTISLSALSNPMTVEWVQFEMYVQEIVLQDPYGYAPVPRPTANSGDCKQALASVPRPLRRTQKTPKGSHCVLY